MPPTPVFSSASRCDRRAAGVFHPTVLGILLIVFLPTASRAQPDLLTVNQVVARALEKYPAVGVSRADVTAAAAGIRLARTSYLPRIDAVAQANRATRNNVAGLLFPQGLPAISGPASDQYSGAAIWGSAVGVTVAWEPVDFGLRSANIAVAEAAKTRADAAASRTRLEVATLAADSFLTQLAAEQIVKAAQAGVERSDVFLRVVESLVQAEIRPGVELSRGRAENSAARTQLIQSRQAVAVAQALLASLLGLEPPEARIAAGLLLELPPGAAGAPNLVTGNPAVLEQDTVVQETRARLKSLERSYYPRLSLLGSVYARGTGAHLDGTIGAGSDGLKPDTRNWAVGVTASLPLMDFASLRARQASEAARVEGETSRYQQIVEDLKGRLNASLAAVDAARQIAANTPVQLEAAQATHRQAVARYGAGLSTVIEVSDAQRLLTQAEIDDALAKLGVWRAMLLVASAQGDLQPFLQRAGQ
jgi:outer membrane protein